MQSLHIPQTRQKRVVIIGTGFGGLKLGRKLARRSEFQVVLLDKHNFYQFQPLYYQVATSGLEPSAIIYPTRKIFQQRSNVFIRICEVQSIDAANKQVNTSEGSVTYDYLVIATGADTNYYGMQNIMRHALPMKTITEALSIRNRLLENMELALTAEDQTPYLNLVIVGGGPTGVELAGALSEMKTHLFPKDYHEIDTRRMRILLIEASGKLLAAMSEHASAKAKEYLEKMGVEIWLNTSVKDYDGTMALLSSGSTVQTRLMVWAAGVKANILQGIDRNALSQKGRILVNQYNQVEGMPDVFAIGDVAEMRQETYPNGHPQVAQGAIQQAAFLAKNLTLMQKGGKLVPFSYTDKGSMATVGRNKAVVDLSFIKFAGFIAWVSWMLLHLMYILGVKNRLLVFINWLWNYITYDQSLRLIIKDKKTKSDTAEKPASASAVTQG